jgi:hypothetical protein
MCYVNLGGTDLDAVRLPTCDPGREGRQTSGYATSIPTHANCEWTWDDARINTLLEETTLGVSKLIPTGGFDIKPFDTAIKASSLNKERFTRKAGRVRTHPLCYSVLRLPDLSCLVPLV